MARIPTVGPKAVHTVQLSPRLRRIEARRARRATHREHAPVIAADKATLHEVGGNLGREVQSIKGATAMTDSALLQALRGGLKGLKGQYRQQVKSELLARLHDAAATVPALVAEAQETAHKEGTEARQQLRSDVAARQQDFAETFDQRLKELRGQGATAVKEKEEEAKKKREERGEGGGLELDPKAIHNAELALANSLVNWGKNVKVEINGKKVPIQKFNPLHSAADWRQWAEEMVAHGEGFELSEAMAAIHRYLQTRSGPMHKGKVPQAGVPYGPRQTKGF